MKTTKIRTVAAILAAVFSISLFAGCDSTDEVTTGTTAATTPAATTAETTTAEAPPPSVPEVEDDGWVSAVFGGGPFVTQLTDHSRTLNLLRNSGFNTAIVWSVHVHDDGSLWLNDVKVADNGKVVAGSRYTKGWKQIKGEGSSVTRVELSIGAWGCKDFEAIGAMMKRDGTGPETELYQNFKALIDAFDADAINYDDETCYDPAILTQFGEMCVDMGVKVTLCPYNNMNMWKQVKENLGDAVDRIYLQCYDGGASNVNQLSEWRAAFGMDVIPGLWEQYSTAKQVSDFIGNKINQRFITGGFMWLWDQMEGKGSPNAVADYADAINKHNKY